MSTTNTTNGPTSPTTANTNTNANTTTTTIANTNTAAPNEAAAKLVEAIDDFLGDIERKFKTISEEVMAKLDDMSERCDRLERDMLASEAGGRKGSEVDVGHGDDD